MSKKKKDEIYQQMNEQIKMKLPKSNGKEANPNRKSVNYQGEYTPQQMKGHNFVKPTRGNSQPPTSQDFKNILSKSEEGTHSNQHQSRKSKDMKHFEYQQIEEAQKLRDRKERERLLQQYTINQPQGMSVPRNISAFQQLVKFPIQQPKDTHNFVMHQTHNEGGFGSPNKHHSKNRRQVAVSPNLNHSSNPYSSAQIHGIDAPINSMSMDHHRKYKSNHTAEKPYSGNKGEYEQIQGYTKTDIGTSKMSGNGKTKTILTTLGVEQQLINVQKRPITLNQGQYDNLYQAQLNGQIKINDQSKIYQTQKNQDQKHGLKFEQNFFKGPHQAASSNASSFLPSIDAPYKVDHHSRNVQHEIHIPGTPGGKNNYKDADSNTQSKTMKKQQVEHMKLKIGDTSADLHITIQGGDSEDKTPRHSKSKSIHKSNKKESINLKSANQQIRAKPSLQPQINANRNNNKDRQLEDLNETLQRLAREKAEAHHGKNWKVQTIQRKAVRAQLIQENQVPGYQMIEKEYFQEDGDYRNQKKKYQNDSNHTYKYKNEKNQRVQLLMGDNGGSMIVSQRLQGVKQNIPSTTPNTIENEENGIEYNLFQSPQKQQQINPNQIQLGAKVLKIQKTDVTLKKKNTENTYENEKSLDIFLPKEKSTGTNLRANHNKMRNIVIDSASPEFGINFKEQKIGEQSPINQSFKQQEERFSVIDHRKQKELENSRAHFQTKRSVENPINPNLYINMESRFSSVIEDVENEQMKSPTARASKLSAKYKSHLIRQDSMQNDSERVRATQDNALRGENQMKVIQFLGHKRRSSNTSQEKVELDNLTRNTGQPKQSTYSIPSQNHLHAEQLMESRDDLDEDPSLFQTRQGVAISLLELKEQQIISHETPDGSRSRRQYQAQKSPNRETNYSQVFNLQSARLEQNKSHEPSATLGREVLASALKPPPGPLRTSPKKQMLTTRNPADNKRYSSNIATKRQSNTHLDLEPNSPTAHSNGSAERRQNHLGEYNQKALPESLAEKQTRKKQISRINQLRDSKESTKSGPQKEQALAQPKRTHQIYTPRAAQSGSVGDPLERVSGKFGASQSPQTLRESRGPRQVRGENGQAANNQSAMVPHNTKRNQQRLQSQTVEDEDAGNSVVGKGDSSYLPHIDPRSTSKSPIRGIGALKPPVAPPAPRVESVAHTAHKSNNLSPQKGGKRRQQLQSPQKAHKRPASSKHETEADDSSEANDKIKALRLGLPVKSKNDNCSYCQEYCQYRGVQIPKQWRELFTHNRFRKSEGGQVWSQRLFMSKECAQSEDRRMMPILIINLDGAMGFWDDTVKNHYVLRQKAMESLITLSQDFRLVAVSSQQQKLIFKLIYGLMNMPATDDQGHVDTNSLRHLYFDAVYQLQSTNEDRKFQSTQKNIDCIHFDLTQVLLDMQFKRQKSASKKEEQIEPEGAKDENFLTFWESEQYRPYQKVLIFTTEQYLNKNHCYSFDYNYLFQAHKFNNEQSKKSPVVIQLPHLRVNPKISFDVVHQMIFTLQYISHAVHLETQANHLIINGKLFENPEISSFEVCKKLLSSKWRSLENKMKHSANPKGLRVFDSDNDPYVNLESINFSEGYKFLKKFFAQRSPNWLRIQKYYLKPRPSKQDKIQKMKLIAKVTFNDSPEIIRMGEDNGSQITKAVGTTHDSSKAESVKESKTTMYLSDDAKNLYNGLMIRNFKLQQEINSYARHHRIQNQAKQAHLKLMENKNEAAERPIVIFDGDTEQEKPRSSLKQYTNTKSSIREGESTEKVAAIQAPTKAYSLKYRALIIKSGELYEQWQTNDCDFSKYQVVNLRVKVNQASFERCLAGVPATPSVAQTTLSAQQQLALQNTLKIALDKPQKVSLLDYLCKRQARISYTTSQEMHLKNNLSQLVEGKQQYADQQKNLADQDKEGAAQQLPNINEKDNKLESYLEGI